MTRMNGDQDAKKALAGSFMAYTSILRVSMFENEQNAYQGRCYMKSNDR